MKSRELSESPLETKELYEQAADLFSAVVANDPAELWVNYRFGALNHAIEFSSETPDQTDKSVKDLVKFGALDVAETVQKLLVSSNYSGTIEERIQFATHPKSVAALGVLAARREDDMFAAINQISRDQTVFPTTADNYSAGYNLARSAAHSPEVSRCPFAGLYDENGGVLQEPAPLFRNFAAWAAELGVYYDSESYNKRHGLDV